MQQVIPQEEQPLATARPAIYIDVIINNQKQVYEVDVARELQVQLGMALKSLDGAPAAPPPGPKRQRKVKPAVTPKRNGSK